MNENKLPMQAAEAVKEIVGLAIEVQNAGAATVFVNLYGHTQKLEVRVFAPVWDFDAPETWEGKAYLDKAQYSQDDINEIVKKLESYLVPA